MKGRISRKRKKIAKKKVSKWFENEFDRYLIMVGIRSHEYSYTDEELFNNIEYFKRCCIEGLSAYKSLLFLNDYMKGDCKI